MMSHNPATKDTPSPSRLEVFVVELLFGVYVAALVAIKSPLDAVLVFEAYCLGVIVSAITSAKD